VFFRLAILALVSALAAAQYSHLSDADLGAEIARQYRARYGVVDMPSAKTYLERIAAEAGRALDANHECCRIELLQGSAGAPQWPQAGLDGRIFVPIKSLVLAQDEAAFVRRMAHAVAHVQQDRTVDADGLPPIRVAFHGAWCDKPGAVPADMRAEFESRERKADEAAEIALGAVALGSSEFEQLRSVLSRPEPPPPVP
jgi:hypothetical protein